MSESPNIVILLVVLNLVFAVIALAVGFVAGAWAIGNRRRAGAVGADAEQVAQLARQQQIERERAALATNRLRDLAGGVATDLGEHSEQVGQITAGLRELDTNDIEATGAGLIEALSKIVNANETLQDRLNKAEEQIAAQAEEIHLHESEARTDCLTGLANRRAFDDEMKRRHAEALRKGTPLSLLILDIDFFKKFNDTHGHQAGDEVLRGVGRKLIETCRDMDLPCRYGGEEFAVVMPATNTEEGKIAGERVRAAIEATNVEFEGQQLSVTTSVGLAQLGSGESIANLLKRADRALYDSKDAGRNCCHWHDGHLSRPFTEQPTKSSNRVRKSEADTPPTQVLDALPNRTKFAEELRRRMAESARTEQPIAVLVVELLDFKAIRSKFGPEVGCAALDAVASVFSHSLRDMDLLARLSDNRFSVLLPQNDRETAHLVGDRAVETLRQCPLELGGESFTLDLKLGAAELKTGDTVEGLVGRAEAALQDVESKSTMSGKKVAAT